MPSITGSKRPRSAARPANRRSGTIRLEARHRAGMLQIVLADDGRGIDLERLRAKVVERGLTTAAMAARLSEAELLDFLFLPGFSTKEQVTEISGRGVGLDVVQSMVQAVRGSVKVASRARQGNAVRPPVADHRLGHPRPAGRDRRRALCLSR